MKLTEHDRLKIDNNDDKLFYREPKLVYHLDSNFRKKLTEHYRRRLKSSSVILDLMSSWVSHLPPEKYYKHVIGHGLNEKELFLNKRLNSFFIQDLNANFKLPYKENYFDYVLIVAGWQYLQYPEHISAELYRITKSGGEVIISFTNRAFWNKTPNIWLNGDDDSRSQYIISIMNSNNWKTIERIYQKPFQSFLKEFIHLSSDPFISLVFAK